MTIPKQSVRHLKLEHLIGHSSNIRAGKVSALSPDEKLIDMARSVREHGIIEPLIVTEHPTELDRWLILAGHRRRAAAELAGLETVPCVIRHGLDGDQDEQLVVMVIENCQRENLNAMERAEALGVLQKRGLSVEQISKRTGLGHSTVTRALDLLNLDRDTRERVRAGEVGVTVARGAIQQVRQATRTKTGMAQPGPPVRVEAPYFTNRHPLAGKILDSCTHTTRPLVGKVGCGQCWEQAIRADVAGR